MKVRVTTAFHDRTKDMQLQPVGTVLDVDKQRAEILINRGLAEPCEEPKKKENTDRK